jgi:hypothetical protein
MEVRNHWAQAIHVARQRSRAAEFTASDLKRCEDAPHSKALRAKFRSASAVACAVLSAGIDTREEKSAEDIRLCQGSGGRVGHYSCRLGFLRED